MLQNLFVVLEITADVDVPLPQCLDLVGDFFFTATQLLYERDHSRVIVEHVYDLFVQFDKLKLNGPRFHFQGVYLQLFADELVRRYQSAEVYFVA